MKHKITYTHIKLFFFLTFSLLIILSAFFWYKSSATGWYNESWDYRRPITITSATSTLTNFQVLVNFDSTTNYVDAGKLQNDCDDLIFTSDDGTTALDYYLEPSTCNTSATRVWVEVSSIANGENTIYMYYGNSGASAYSNGDNTFKLFDLNGDSFLGSSSSSADGHECAISATSSPSKLYCWGYNIAGAVGNGNTTNTDDASEVGGLSGVMGVSAAGGVSATQFTCAVLNDGTINCWGDNSSGQLGDGNDPNDSTSPVVVSGISTAVEVATAVNSACALLSNGTVKCWGNNSQTQLGKGYSGTSSSTPNDPVVDIDGNTLTGVVQISGGGNHFCALISDGTARCWGDNTSFGQLGLGHTTDTNYASTTINLSGVAKISAGYFHTCALLSSGQVKCWGFNTYAQLGIGTTGGTNTSPGISVINIDSDTITNFTDITASGYHSCGILSDGTVRCWGRNYYSELGTGNNTQSAFATTTIGVSTAVAIAAGGYNNSIVHSCALLESGYLQCWGGNTLGQCGLGHITSPQALAATTLIYNAGGRFDKTGGIDAVPDFTSDIWFIRAYDPSEPTVGAPGAEETNSTPTPTQTPDATPTPSPNTVHLGQYGDGKMYINYPLTDRWTDGLVGYWSFNGQDMDWSATTAEAIDRSGNSNNGNVVGGATAVPGKVGQALSFDGVDNKITISNISNIGAEGTIEAWIYPKQLSGNQHIYVGSTAGVNARHPELIFGGTTLYMKVSNGSSEINASVSNVLNNNWYHIVGVWSVNEDKVKIYVDGVLKDNQPIGFTPSTNAANDIIGYFASSFPEAFNGLIDEVRIYNRALSAGEVFDHYRVGRGISR